MKAIWIRSIFGTHEFQQYTYSDGANRKIELYPISARMQLPELSWSYMLQEFSQMFCVDQAFHQASGNLERFFSSKYSVDTLELINFKMGQEADAFLDHLPTPKKSQESQSLVASADCKGVPFVKADAEKVAAFETGKIRPGNRRMATVGPTHFLRFPILRTCGSCIDRRTEKNLLAAEVNLAAVTNENLFGRFSLIR